MPFMVIYDRADGSSGHESADAIDEAAHFVERLRNDQSVDQIRLFRTEEISFGFRPYYKVELGLPPKMASAAGITSAIDDIVGRPAEETMPPRQSAVVNGASSASAASGLFRR